MFIDEARFRVEAGRGGHGCVSFRREKYVPFGGPDGGDGGKGGDVVLEVNPQLRTLSDYRYQHEYKAPRGTDGKGKKMTGRSGKDLVLQVPRGTVVYDDETGELLADLVDERVRLVVAEGGRGGRGNPHFATASHRVPRERTLGKPGQVRTVRLELKLLADVGLVGFPNAGKSTFINTVTRAKSVVGDYPFTTLTPHLGVISLYGEEQLIFADIPGIIEGAHEGVGLGHQFLRHIERTRVLLHLVDVSPFSGREPVEDYEQLRTELAAYDSELATKPEIVVATKVDVPEHEERLERLREHVTKAGREFHAVSALTRDGVDDLVKRAWELNREAVRRELEASEPS